MDGWLSVILIVMIFSAGVLKAAGAWPASYVARSLVPWGLGLTALAYVGFLITGYRSEGIFYVITFGKLLIASVVGVVVAFSLARLSFG